MNIRDFIFINKAKSTDRIKILEMLGFEAETVITQNTETISDLENNNESLDLNSYTNVQTEVGVVSEPSSIESYIKDADRSGGAEFVYLYNIKDKKWYYADTYKDSKLKKLF